MKEFDELKAIVASAEEDIAKVDNGNKAAGIRARKLMQDVKDKAQAVRVKALLHTPADVAAEVGKQVGGPGAVDINDFAT